MREVRKNGPLAGQGSLNDCRSESSEAHTMRRAHQALDAVTGGEQAAHYYLEGGQSRVEAQQVAEGFRLLLDPRTDVQGLELLLKIAAESPGPREAVGRLMRASLTLAA
jgi:hypothetical protein